MQIQRIALSTLSAASLFLINGCTHPKITAVNLNDPKAPEGIPYYLPKPYLVVSKNIRYIPAPTVGLTQTAPIPDSFDPAFGGGAAPAEKKDTPKEEGGDKKKEGEEKKEDKQSGGKDGDKNKLQAEDEKGRDGQAPSAAPVPSSQVFGPASIAVVPAAAIPDGYQPDTFYTYQIVYLPDLTQKYGLRVKGGMGEMRATLNLVNGWMNTGPGPVYFKDSSSAQTILASGTAVSGVLESGAKFASAMYGIPSIGGSTTGTNQLQAENVGGRELPSKIEGFARLWIFEPVLVKDPTALGGTKVEWHQLTGTPLAIERDILAAVTPVSAPPATDRSQKPSGDVAIVAKAIEKLNIRARDGSDLSVLKVQAKGDKKEAVLNKAITDDDQTRLLNDETVKKANVTSVRVQE